MVCLKPNVFDNPGMTSQDKLLTLVINLDRSPHRLARIARELEDISWPWERLPAAEGKNLPLDDGNLVDVAAFKRKHGKMPLPGEVGCYLSHVWAMQRFLQTDREYLLILEDDLRIGPDMPRVVQALLDCESAWDVVMLSGIHPGPPLVVRRLGSGYALSVPLVRYAGSSCYLLSRYAAQVYLRDLLPMSLPYDHEYDRAWARGLKTRVVRPAPCVHSFEDASDLHPAGVVRQNFHWTRRLGAYGWRLRSDLHRIAHGLGQWLKHRA